MFRARWLVALVLGAGSVAGSVREDPDSLHQKFWNRVSAASSRGRGDAEADRAFREAAAELRAKAWKLVRSARKDADVEAAWRMALWFDAAAGERDELLEHARDYLEERAHPDSDPEREGLHRGYAAALLLEAELDLAETAEEQDDLIERFDREHPRDLLRRGIVRTYAARIASREGDVERAVALHRAAAQVADPADDQHPVARGPGEGEDELAAWREWCLERIPRLRAYGRDWSELGGEDLEGQPWKVADFRGEVLLIEYWASW